jgi:sodium transport system permease protein
VGSLLSIAGLMIPFFSGLKVYAWLVRGGMQLNPLGIGVTLLIQIPLSVLFAGLLIAISTFSRNQKEAQSYLGPLLIAIIVPAMMSMFLGAEVSRTMALVPVLNASLIIKQALLNSYDTPFILIALGASVVYAGISVLFCTRLFQKEAVLIKA